MFETIEESPLFPILNPRSMVFFGASNRFTAMGTNLLCSVKALGFEGRIYPVHSKEEVVQGFKAYQRVGDIPDVPDLALMVLPAQVVPETLEACGKRGIKRAIIVSGGFKETGGEGLDLEKRLVEIADKYRIRFIGPNCIGVANPYHKLNTTFLQYETTPGFIGMASQSGSFITQIFDYLAQFSLGFSVGISVGNEANIDLVDAMEYLGACPNTRVIALYIEAIRRGRRFIKVARSIIPRKPIVAFYAGGSEAGKKAGFSHTGAMAGPDLLYEGVFRQSGVLRARSIEELFDFCWVLGQCPKPKGNRVIIQTHSGGPGAAAADACGRAGLEMPPLSPETKAALSSFVPHTASINNPVDLTFNKNPADYFSKIPESLLKEKGADGLLIYFMTPPHTIRRALKAMGVADGRAQKQAEEIIEKQSQRIVTLIEKQQKPVLGYSFRSRSDLMIKRLQEGGIPVLPGPERAARAMGALVRYATFRDKVTGGAGAQI